MDVRKITSIRLLYRQPLCYLWFKKAFSPSKAVELDKKLQKFETVGFLDNSVSTLGLLIKENNEKFYLTQMGKIESMFAVGDFLIPYYRNTITRNIKKFINLRRDLQRLCEHEIGWIRISRSYGFCRDCYKFEPREKIIDNRRFDLEDSSLGSILRLYEKINNEIESSQVKCKHKITRGLLSLEKLFIYCARCGKIIESTQTLDGIFRDSNVST